MGSTVPTSCEVCGPGLIQWKRCSSCREWKTREYYSPVGTGGRKVRADCRPCHSKDVIERSRRVAAPSWKEAM